MNIINFHPLFSENAECMSLRHGIPIQRNLQTFEGLYIVFGAHEKSPELLHIQSVHPTVRYVIMNSEQPGSNVMRNKFYLKLMENNVVFNMDSLQGYSPIFFEFPYTPGTSERDIDVLFLGCESPKRRSIYETMRTMYPEKIIVFHFANQYPNPTSILQRAKVVLNIPYYENNQVLETHRINKALACGCRVLSQGDPVADYVPYVTFTKTIEDLIEEPNKKGYTDLLSLADRYGKHNAFILAHL